MNAEIATDYQVEAAALLRRYQAPRVVSEVVRPTYRTDDLPEVEYEPLSVVVARQRERADRILALSLEERSALIAGLSRNGNGDGSSD